MKEGIIVECEVPTCMQLTRLPFWTELNFWVLLEKTVAALRPEKAFTVEVSDDPTLEEAAAKAAGATTAEAATMEAMASEASSPRERRRSEDKRSEQRGRWDGMRMIYGDEEGLIATTRVSGATHRKAGDDR
jgi:hypothetical protein